MSTKKETSKKVEKKVITEKKEKDLSLTCTSITKQGTRCTRKIVENNMCNVHGKISISEKLSGSSSVTDKSFPLYTCSECKEYTTYKYQDTYLCYRHMPDL